MASLDDLFALVGKALSNAVSPRTLRNLRSELRGSLLAKVGIFLVVFVLFVAVFAPLIAPHNPTNQTLEKNNLPPIGFSKETTVTSTEMVNGSIQVVNETRTINASPSYPMGTDNLGRGMFSRVLYGARTSLLVGVFGTSLAVVLGVAVGLTAGYYRGLVDDVLMRTADIMLAFPSLVLAIALIGVVGTAAVEIPDPLVDRLGEQVVLPVVGLSVPVPDPLVGFGGFAGWFRGLPVVRDYVASTPMPESVVLPGTVVLVVALVNWVWFARVARSEALSVREEEYVKAARSMGASDVFILWRHVLPNSITPILVLATIQIAAIILLESALSFLGFSGTTLSWGFDISQGREYLSSSWWIATVPGMAIVLTVIGINLVGDWLRDALDPGIQGEGNA